MKFLNYCLSVSLFVLFSLCFINDLHAQRNVSYPQLANSNQQNLFSVNEIVLPGDSDSTVTLATIFSLPYSYLSFKKRNASQANRQFAGVFEIGMEVFQSNKSNLRKDRKEVSIQGLKSVARTFSSDTAYAENYEQSESDEQFLSGHLKVSLSPGIYSYILQLNQGQNKRISSSRSRTLRLNSYRNMESGNVILGEQLVENNKSSHLTLSKLGKNVEYGKDYYALAYLPGYDQNSTYTVELTTLNAANSDTNKINTVYTQKLSSDHIRNNIKPRLVSTNNNERTYLNLASSSGGFTYALINIPGKELPNSMYRLTITKDGEQKAIASTTFRSIWVNIPTSLLSLDVAIDMLRYIADDKTIDNLSQGTQKEREKKFRSYWEKRDPTPNTDFNELMAEYYRRIDYAYKNFTTENTLGYNSDQGEIYIKYGPPNNINRKYPTNGATTEIWTYPSRKFVFKATSGFGDFRLVSNESQ